MGPTEWRGRSIRVSEQKSPTRDVRAVPDLFRKHQTLTGKSLERADELGCGETHGKKVARALAGQDGPRAAAPAAVPGRPVLVLAVTVTDVTAPAWAGREADLQRGVDALQAAQDSIVLWPAQTVPDQLEKLGGDRAFGGAVIWVAGQAHVVALGG